MLLAVTLNIYFLILSNIVFKYGCTHLVSLYFQCHFWQTIFLIHSANVKDPLQCTLFPYVRSWTFLFPYPGASVGCDVYSIHQSGSQVESRNSTAWFWPFGILPSFPHISLCPRVSERCERALLRRGCQPGFLSAAPLPVCSPTSCCSTASGLCTHTLSSQAGLCWNFFSCAYWFPPFLRLHSWLAGITFFKLISCHYLHSLLSMSVCKSLVLFHFFVLCRNV